MADKVTCPMCGFENQAGANRCVSCGAKIEALGAGEYTAEEELARRYEQETFEWKWVGIACGGYVAMAAIALAGLPAVISNFDPMGLPGLGLCVVIWFCGGILMGFLSPGKTFIEPAVGSALATIPTIAYQMAVTPEGFDPPLFTYIVFGVIGVMMALFGAFLGERIQMGSEAKA